MVGHRFVAPGLAMTRSILQSNEGKCCDVVLHMLEHEMGANRGTLRFPERENHSAPVELVCTVGNVQVAVEHTMLEAYPDQTQDGVRFVAALERLERELGRWLPKDSFFMLIVPSNAFDGLSHKQARDIAAHIGDWVRAVAPTMDRRLRIDGRRAADIPGVPFEVALDRMAGIRSEHGQLRIARVRPDDLEGKRLLRIQRALDSKLPKLAAWKARSAMTVLVLENGDIALSNVALILTTIHKACPPAALLPDRIYQVDTPGNPWYVWTLRCAPEIGIRGLPLERHDVDPARLQDVLALR